MHCTCRGKLRGITRETTYACSLLLILPRHIKQRGGERLAGGGGGGGKAAVFNIRPLKRAAKSAPATLKPWTDPCVQASVSPWQCGSAIHATSGHFTVGSLSINEIRSAKTSRQTRMANLNSGAPPSSLSSSFHRGAHPRCSAVVSESKSCFPSFYCRPYYHQLGRALVSEHVAPT